MSDLLGFIAARPWIVVLLALGLAVWIAAIWSIVRSPKFLRKWLWVLLTLVSFTYSWEVRPGFYFGIGIPLGAIYVLWFARWGRSPTALEVERRRRTTGAQHDVAAPRLMAVRLGYAGAAAGAVVLWAWSIFGPMDSIISSFGPPPEFFPAVNAIKVTASVLVVLLAGLFVFLSVRPYGWGKLICLLAGVSWLGHGLMALFLLPMFPGIEVNPLAYATGPIVAGTLVLACAIVHQFVDRRIGGPYLTAA